MNDGCKYCTEWEDLPEFIRFGKPVGRVFDTCIDETEDGWCISVGNLDLAIIFCPYCGRKLDKEEN